MPIPNVNFTDPSTLITLVLPRGREYPSLNVVAPLPDSFGVDIQSEITQPFSSFIPQGMIHTAVALFNLSMSAGVAIGKFYTGTSTPDITFDMQFVTQSDALNDVMIPVLKLYVMAASHKQGLPPAVSKVIVTGANAVETGVGAGIKALSGISSSLGGPNFGNFTATPITVATLNKFLYWFKGPPPIRAYFGNVYALGENTTYNPIIISALSPRFSNNVDYNGLPMQCTVSVTLTLRQPFLDGDAAHMASQYHNVNMVR